MGVEREFGGGESCIREDPHQIAPRGDGCHDGGEVRRCAAVDEGRSIPCVVIAAAVEAGGDSVDEQVGLLHGGHGEGADCLQDGQEEGLIVELVGQAVDCLQDLAEAAHQDDEDDAEPQGDQLPPEDQLVLRLLVLLPQLGELDH